MTMAMTGAAAVATARRWFRLLGRQPIVRDGAIIIADPAHPDVWDANFAFAEAGADPAAIIAALDGAMPHSRWRVVTTDALTDLDIEAALALAGFTQGNPVIEMLATGPVTPRHPIAPIRLRRVATDEDWAVLGRLIRIDHAEGKRTGAVTPAVGDGLIKIMRVAAPDMFSLIILDDVPAGYGLALPCPGGLGLIENLFTLPEARGRGLMSAFIAQAVDQLRAQGCDRVFLDAHAGEQAKRLYASLGFRPVALSRSWTRQVSAAPD